MIGRNGRIGRGRSGFSWVIRVGLAAAAAILFWAILTPAIARATEDDRAVTERMVADLQHDSAHATLTADAVAHAKQALERALRMRQAGDETRARDVEGLARRWAEMGRDLARTADAEAQAGLIRSAANDAGAHVERERALLEETIARTGRLKAEIEAAEKEENAAPTRTAAVAKNADAGASKNGGSKKLDASGDGGVMKMMPMSRGDGGVK